MSKAAVLGFAALAAALAPPLHATLYVPVGDGPLGAVRYTTSVVVTNPDAVPRRFTAAFLAAGLSRAGSPVTLPAHGTFVLSGLAREGERGLLAIDGPPQLLVSARLAAISANGAGADGKSLSGAAVPVVAAGSLVPAGQTIHLQGLERNGRTVSRLGLVTLGDRAGTCTATAFRADGSPLGRPVQVAVPARGQSALPDALAAAGVSPVSEARMEVTCDIPAFAWAAVLSHDGARTATAAPASALGASPTSVLGKARRGEGDVGNEGRQPGNGTGGNDGGGNGGNGGNGGDGGNGGNGGDGGGNGGGGDTPPGDPTPDDDGSFSLPGTFLDATPGDSYREYELALRPGVRYKRLTVDFDLFLNRWQSSLFHAVTGLRRADKTLYYGLILRADRAKTIFDLGKGQLAKDDGGLWQEGTNYHIRTTYDVESRQVTLEVFRGGDPVEVLTGPMTTTDLRETNRKVRVDFGIAKVADGAYFPPVGWKFSNLEVKAVPF